MIKKDKPDYWCKGLYLKAGEYMIGEVGIELHKDMPLEFISSSLFKVKGIPSLVRRELLKESKPTDENKKG